MKRTMPWLLMLLLAAGVVPPAVADTPEQPSAVEAAERSFRAAAAFYQRGAWALAAEEFQLVATEHALPDRRRAARFYQAECLIQLGRDAEAQALLANLADSDPTDALSAKVQLRLAELAQRGGRLDEAATRLAPLMEADEPPSPEILARYAEVALLLGQLDAAETAWQRLDPTRADTATTPAMRLIQGRLLREQGQLDRARAVFSEVAGSGDRAVAQRAEYERLALDVAHQPEGLTRDNFETLAAALPRGDALRPFVAVLHARWLFDQGEFPQATEHLRSAMHQVRQPPLEWQHLLGWAYLRQHNWTAAVDWLAQVADHPKAEPELARKAWLAAGRAWMELAEFPQALRVLEPFADDDPAAGLLVVGCHYALDRRELAVAVGQRLLAAEGRGRREPARLAIRLADRAFEAHDYESAADWYATTQADWPTRDDGAQVALRHLWSVWELGRAAQATEAASRVIRHWPDSEAAAQAALVLGHLAADRADWPAATRHYAQAAGGAAGEVRSEALLRAGRCAQFAGQRREAIAHYQAAWSALPETAAARHDVALSLAEVYRHEGAWDEVERVLAEVVSAEAASHHTPEALSRLAEAAARREDHPTAAARAEQVLRHPEASLEQRSANLERLGRAAHASGDWEGVRRVAWSWADASNPPRLRWIAEFWLAESSAQADEHESAAQRFASCADQAECADLAARGGLRAAQCWFAAGRTDTAQQAAERLVRIWQLHPERTTEWVEAAYLAGRCAARRGEYSAARMQFAAAVERGGSAQIESTRETAAKCQWMIGETYFHQQRWQQAARAYQRVVVAWPHSSWRPAALLQAAKCHLRLGSPETAQTLYAQLVNEAPHSEYAAEARNQLDQLQTATSDARKRY